MKKILGLAAFLALAAFSVHSLFLIQRKRGFFHRGEIKVLLVHSGGAQRNGEFVLSAYRSVLEEEGFPVETLSAAALLSLKEKDVLKSVPAIIFPDGAATYLPMEMKAWIERYLGGGGNIAVIYDPGTRNVKGAFLKEAVLAGATGINYIAYERYRDKAYTLGHIKFQNQKSLTFLQIPPGKTQESLLLGGYAYGTLEYPVAQIEVRRPVDPDDVYAVAETLDGEEFPAVVMNRCGPGKALYVNLPLGYLKSFSDDFPLRAILRSFLVRELRMPHLVNVRDGRGGLVVNWHIDASIDWQSLESMLRDGYLMKDLRYSLDITAGDFRDEPGDGLGFDACGKGRRYLELIKGYGTIGSHGGWAHNWFAENIENGTFRKTDIEAAIRKNNACLESVTGVKILEYAAPNGVHPQPVTTEVLDELGFLAYYYTGDTGSAPNRTFFNGKKISDKLVAFPILPMGKSASFYEMEERGKTEEEVQNWLLNVTDYVINQRTVRLVYSHPYDIPNYPGAIKTFLQYAVQRQKEGSLRVDSMSGFARFFLRFLKTKSSFRRHEGRWIVSLKNPEGLEGVTIALPKADCRKPETGGLTIREDEDYYYLTIEGLVNEAEFSTEARR